MGGTTLTGIYRTVDQLRFEMTRKSSALPLWQKNSVVNQVRDISHLTDDWDGYGGASVEKNAISIAMFLLESLSEYPNDTLPSTAGTLLFKWDEPRGKASLELGRETFSFYASPKAGKPIFLGGKMQEIDAQDINAALATIAGHLKPQSLEDLYLAGSY